LGHKLKSPVVVERVIQFLEEKDVSFNDVSWHEKLSDSVIERVVHVHVYKPEQSKEKMR
jgi:CRISPR/Cas system endoribonuclease Cas6 (RAMP superfamily)